MDEAVQFLKNKKFHSSKEILPRIKKSLSVLELFQNDNFLYEISDILLKKTKHMDLNDSEWSAARSIALTLMAHNLTWVQTTFYKSLADMVKSILVGEDNDQTGNEKCLILLCDVEILTEICCHGLSSKVKEVGAFVKKLKMKPYYFRLLVGYSAREQGMIASKLISNLDYMLIPKLIKRIAN